MKAIIMSAIGGPEVLQVADLPKPAPGPNQLLVRIHAAGVNPIDYKLRKTGAMGIKPGAVLGFDAAGVVEQTGPGVVDFSAGDAVFYSPGFGLPGAYAQYHIVDAAIVAHKPANLSFEESAALPLAAMTAYDGVITRGAVRLGHTVLLTAVNGAVGGAAVQLCKAAGAFVFAIASSRSADFARQLAPDRLIQYDRENFVEVIQKEAPQGLDLMYDCVGQDYISRAIPLMKPEGRIVTIVNPTGQLAEGYRRNVTIHYEFLQRRRATLEMIKTLIERRQLRPFIDSILPLEQAAEAHRKLEAGGVQGKIVLRVD